MQLDFKTFQHVLITHNALCIQSDWKPLPARTPTQAATQNREQIIDTITFRSLIHVLSPLLSPFAESFSWDHISENSLTFIKPEK